MVMPTVSLFVQRAYLNADPIRRFDLNIGVLARHGHERRGWTLLDSVPDLNRPSRQNCITVMFQGRRLVWHLFEPCQGALELLMCLERAKGGGAHCAPSEDRDSTVAPAGGVLRREACSSKG